MLIDTLFQSALYIPLVLGIFLSFRILRLTDLTADGSFVLGGGIYARLLVEGYSQGVACLSGIIGGGIVGFILAYIQKNNRLSSILASILCIFMLQSINLMVMGRPNIVLLAYNTSLDTLYETHPWVVLSIGGIFFLILIGLFVFLIQSKMGLIGRAFGMNYHLLQKRGYPPEMVRRIGLVLSNMLYAFSGILCVCAQKFADISMGLGISLIGIGSVIIGGQLFSLVYRGHSSAFNAKRETFSCIIGIIFYFLLMAFFLRAGVDPSFIKLFLGMILTFLFICNVRRIKI